MDQPKDRNTNRHSSNLKKDDLSASLKIIKTIENPRPSSWKISVSKEDQWMILYI